MMTKVAPDQRDNVLNLISLRKAFYKDKAVEAKKVGEDLLSEVLRGNMDQLKMIEDMLKAKFEVYLSDDDWILLGR